MKKRRLILLGVAAVTLILLLAAVLLLILEIRDLSKVKETFDRTQQQLNSYYAGDPFPSATNVAVVTNNTVEIREWREKLIADLSQGQVMPDKKKTPAAFINELSSARIRLAKAGGPSVVEESFPFGFDRYFLQNSVPPARDDVPRLVQQLRMIEAIVGILFKEKIDRLIDVQREAFEVKGRGGGNPEAGNLKEGGLYARFHYVFEFSAREKSLTAVLNRLAAMQPLVVVTQVEIDKNQADVQMPSPDDDDDEDLRDTGSSMTNMLPRDARIVSGIEMAKPFSVTLELDVYWFREGEE